MFFDLFLAIKMKACLTNDTPVIFDEKLMLQSYSGVSRQLDSENNFRSKQRHVVHRNFPLPRKTKHLTTILLHKTKKINVPMISAPVKTIWVEQQLERKLAGISMEGNG